MACQTFCQCEKCLSESQNFYYPTYMPERMQSEEFFGFAARLVRPGQDNTIAIRVW